jgi:hypothetical protein
LAAFSMSWSGDDPGSQWREGLEGNSWPVADGAGDAEA